MMIILGVIIGVIVIIIIGKFILPGCLALVYKAEQNIRV